jgi:hypothetical protein
MRAAIVWRRGAAQRRSSTGATAARRSSGGKQVGVASASAPKREVERYIGLASNQNLPSPGTYVFEPLGDGPVRVAYGSNLIWIDGRMEQYIASGSPSTLTIETATPEEITGRVSMEATEPYRNERVTVAAVFTAERVVRFEHLPRLR